MLNCTKTRSIALNGNLRAYSPVYSLHKRGEDYANESDHCTYRQKSWTWSWPANAKDGKFEWFVCPCTRDLARMLFKKPSLEATSVVSKDLKFEWLLLEHVAFEDSFQASRRAVASRTLWTIFWAFKSCWSCRFKKSNIRFFLSIGTLHII